MTTCKLGTYCPPSWSRPGSRSAHCYRHEGPGASRPGAGAGVMQVNQGGVLQVQVLIHMIQVQLQVQVKVQVQ